jgi:3-keto-5-aminohexanoate cleavage enzyme
MVGSHMRVGLGDNIHIPSGELARGMYELVEVAAKVAECLGREPARPDEALEIMGLKKR